MATRNSPRNVLVMRFSALGDVAISIPVIYSACNAYPETRFVVLTRQWAAQMFVNRPSNLVVKGIDLTHEYKGLEGMVRLACQMRKEYGIDAVADLHSVMRSWAIDAVMRLHGVRVVRIDKGRWEKRQLVSGKIRRQLTTSHDRYKHVFERLRMPFDETFQGFTQCQSNIMPTKSDGEKWVAIAPFSQHRGKEYPLDKIETVIQRLLEHDRVRVMLLGGGAKERKLLSGITQKYPHATSLADTEHEFADEFAVLRQCDVMLSMDSANMHLASLTRTPVVSVWGATHPFCGFLGWGQDAQNVVQLDLPCRPCSVFGQKPCQYDDYHCLTGISPERIVQRVVSVIDLSPGSDVHPDEVRE